MDRYRVQQDKAARPQAGIGLRISDIAELVGGKKRLAQLSGVSESQLYRYISGKSQPTIEPVVAMARAAGAQLEWLATGHGPMRTTPAGVCEPATAYVSCADFVSVPRYGVSTDDQGCIRIEAGAYSYAFYRQWLQARGLEPDQLALVPARGSSMAPLIQEGQLILVDRRVTRVEGEGVYLLALDGSLLAKILQCGPDGSVYLRSANPDYRELVFPPDRVDGLGIVGRAVWTDRYL